MASILVVDDYKDTASSLALWLEQLGYNVQIASDGYRAIEIARRQRPNCVLLDLGLPGFDGYQVAATLRRELPGPLVIIAVTAFSQDEYRQQALAAGCDYCVRKPIDPDTLLPLLSRTRARVDSPIPDGSLSNRIARTVLASHTVSREVEITNNLGFNLRAADKFVRLARQFRADVRIACGNRTASGLSILDLTTLPAGRGSRLELAADGPDAEAALTALAGLIERRFDEQD
jgi:phosphotransferase system HPr (HPr) family protein